MPFTFWAWLAFGAVISGSASAQTAQKLTLQGAEQIAIQNHPQIQAAADLAVAAAVSGDASALRILPHSLRQSYGSGCRKQQPHFCRSSE